jgi:hypothetical protein
MSASSPTFANKRAISVPSPPAGGVFFLDGITQNFSYLFFHVPAMAFGPALQPRLHLILDVPDNKLGHAAPLFMIS